MSTYAKSGSQAFKKSVKKEFRIFFLSKYLETHSCNKLKKILIKRKKMVIMNILKKYKQLKQTLSTNNNHLNNLKEKQRKEKSSLRDKYFELERALRDAEKKEYDTLRQKYNILTTTLQNSISTQMVDWNTIQETLKFMDI